MFPGEGGDISFELEKSHDWRKRLLGLKKSETVYPREDSVLGLKRPSEDILQHRTDEACHTVQVWDPRFNWTVKICWSIG